MDMKRLQGSLSMEMEVENLQTILSRLGRRRASEWEEVAQQRGQPNMATEITGPPAYDNVIPMWHDFCK